MAEIEDEDEFEDDYDWRTIASNEKRPTRFRFSLPRTSKNRFRSFVLQS